MSPPSAATPNPTVGSVGSADSREEAKAIVANPSFGATPDQFAFRRSGLRGMDQLENIAADFTIKLIFHRSLAALHVRETGSVTKGAQEFICSDLPNPVPFVYSNGSYLIDNPFVAIFVPFECRTGQKGNVCDLPVSVHHRKESL